MNTELQTITVATNVAEKQDLGKRHSNTRRNSTTTRKRRHQSPVLFGPYNKGTLANCRNRNHNLWLVAAAVVMISALQTMTTTMTTRMRYGSSTVSNRSTVAVCSAFVPNPVMGGNHQTKGLFSDSHSRKPTVFASSSLSASKGFRFPLSATEQAMHTRLRSSGRESTTNRCLAVFSSVPSSPPSSSLATVPPNERAELLNLCLEKLLNHRDDACDQTPSSTEDGDIGSPSIEIMDAALRSLRDPSSGYDQRYGRPALRCYRSFVYPKSKTKAKAVADGGDGLIDNESSRHEDRIQLEAAALRTANQIDFLIKRHTSKRMDAIRNHDPSGVRGEESGSLEPEPTREAFPLVLVLDNLRGSFNVGSIFRTAEACGVSEILTCGITPHPNGSGAEKVAKSALGADLLVRTRHFATTRKALSALKQPGASSGDEKEIGYLPPLVVALETTAASELYTRFDYRPYYRKKSGERISQEGANNNPSDDNRQPGHQGIALILGNEVTGVDAELMAHLLDKDLGDNELVTGQNQGDKATGLVDAIVELPTYGKKNSLNVAAVAPVILYEILRQWNEEVEDTGGV